MQASVAQQSLILEMQSLDNEIMQANTKLKSLPEIEQLLHIDKRITTATDELAVVKAEACLLYTSPSPRDGLLSRMPSSA